MVSSSAFVYAHKIYYTAQIADIIFAYGFGVGTATERKGERVRECVVEYQQRWKLKKWIDNSEHHGK